MSSITIQSSLVREACRQIFAQAGGFLVADASEFAFQTPFKVFYFGHANFQEIRASLDKASQEYSQLTKLRELLVDLLSPIEKKVSALMADGLMDIENFTVIANREY